MKKVISVTIMLLVALLLLPLHAFSGEHHGMAVTHSKDFARMKGLVGTWEGTSDMGNGPQTIKVTYELTSAGNAVLERLFIGTPYEMVTIYYDYAGKLNMTHYCSFGNQPHMDLMKSGDKSLEFVLSKKNPNLASMKETHMHALRIDFDDKGNITHNWTSYEGGKKKADTVIKLHRVQS